jgi:transcriptional regulator with XRE-family HTH domain
MGTTITPDRGPRVELYAYGLRDIREKAGLTQLDLAVRAGLTPATVSRLENAHQSPTLATAEALAKALDIPLTALLGRPVKFRPARAGMNDS